MRASPVLTLNAFTRLSRTNYSGSKKVWMTKIFFLVHLRDYESQCLMILKNVSSGSQESKILFFLSIFLFSLGQVHAMNSVFE